MKSSFQFRRYPLKRHAIRETIQSKPSFLRVFPAIVCLALGLSVIQSVNADVLDSSLLVRLNFDAAPVNDVITDTSPAGGNPGTNVQATWVASESGRQGVMNFDGTVPGQIIVGPSAVLNASTGTISFWMKSTNVTGSPDGYAILIDRRSAGGDVLFQDPSGHLNNQARQATGGAANSQSTSANVTDGQWHHIAYVYDQSVQGTVSFYVDGILDTRATNSLSWSWVADLPIEIGASTNDTFWKGFTGFLDDFRLYNRVLSAAEIADVAGLGTTPQIAITGQPENLIVSEKDTPSFTVKATVINGNAAQLQYQWQRDDTNILGATNSSYSLTVSAADNNATFRVLLSYPGTTNVTSAAATLTVIPETTLLYSFDAAPVSDVIVDSSTNAIKHNGVSLGATWVASQDGRTGVMSFDGVAENQITIPASPQLSSMRGTIAFWMQSSNVTATKDGYAIVVDHRAQTGPVTGGDVIYQPPDGHLANQARTPTGATVNAQETTFNVTDNHWHHVAYLYDQSGSGSISFYVDGLLDTTKVNSQPWAWVTNQDILIGLSQDTFWSGYSGFLDDFRIYNRVLSPSEIAQLAGIGPQPQIVITRQPANLVAGSNDNPSFSVSAKVVNGDASKLSYQWQKDGVNIPNATNATYSFLVTPADDGKKFRAQVSYPGTTNVLSAEVTLSVLPEFVVHYTFDAAPQGGVIVDSSPGTNHDAVDSGATWVATQDGRSGVISFDPNIPSQITLAGTPDLNSMRGTIAFWMKSTLVPGITAETIILDRRVTPPIDSGPVTGGDVIYQLLDGHISNQAEAAGRARANQFSTVGNPTDGKWHHFAYVYDQTAQGFISYYIDGVLDGTHNNALPWNWVTDQTLEIGKSHDPYWTAYNGFLDDFRIYNRVLSASEIAQLAGAAVPTATLNFSVAAGKLTLSWTSTGFLLQENSNLANPTGWANVPNGNVSPVVITLPTTNSANFYRLKSQ